MRFSIIIPAYNAEATIDRCLRSAVGQPYSEVIVVDDQSSDATGPRAQLCMSMRKNATYCRLAHNSGAGPARNYGMHMARGDWLIFLDADDELAPNATELLNDYLATLPPDVDLVGYNPRDAKWLRGPKQVLLNSYTAMRMDGSVVYTAMRKSAVQDLRFRPGIHEDVEFLCAAYTVARRTAYFDQPIYYKGKAGVTSAITTRHLDGFINAWRGVVLRAHRESVPWPCVVQGIVGLVATRVREIYLKAPSSLDKTNLLHYFHDQLPLEWTKICVEATFDTQYAKIAKGFVQYKCINPQLLRSSWSCRDLQSSAYLGPDEVRACCKRFFVNGEQRGDVVLLGEGDEFTPESIRSAKVQLLREINTGEETCCTGCPWLEFDEHGPVPDHVAYLSMEQHSVCNLKCSYCPEKYYDGRRPDYDVTTLASALLVPEGSVVWGGGEPTVSPEFKELAVLFSKRGARQRVLTNAVKFSETLHSLMVIDQRVEMVVSVDAGSIETFKKVRGSDKLATVLHNLRTYSEETAERVTIKYILTEDNSAEAEIAAFVQLMEDNELLDCNFQVSCDFRQERATQEQVIRIQLLCDLLVAAGAECVFIDDLCRLRLPAMLTRIEAIVVGTGEQADSIKGRIRCVAQVESDSSDAAFLGNAPIIIAASQAYPSIYHELKSRGLSHRVLKGLVL